MKTSDHPSGSHLQRSQRELHPHGTTRFPCAGYTTECSNAPEGVVPWHWHSELEIALVVQGSVVWRTPGVTYSCKTGDLIILNGNTLHSAVGTPEGTLHSLVFSPRLLTGSSSLVFSDKYIQPLMNCGAFSCTVLTGTSECVPSFQTAFDALAQASFAYEFTIREALTGILLTLYKLYEDKLTETHPSLTADNERIERMLAFIHAHYHEDISLEDISRAGQIGRRECLRCFRRTIAESPIQYLLKYRLMESAQMLISQPSAGMSELAGACGFDSPSYFSKQFRRLYQCTPGEYRKSRFQKSDKS